MRDRNPRLNINVAQLLKEPTGAVRWHDLSEDIRGIDHELRILAPLTGTVKMIRTADGIFVTGRLHTVLQLECSRCLEPLVEPLYLEIEAEFHPSVDIQTGGKLPLVEPADGATTIDEQHILDLMEIARQAIFLASPMHPLCREDCAGLCPQCGQDLNEGQCNCVADVVDPRLETLKQLL